MGKYFGTDGFRGEANVTLTVEDAYKVGRFLGWYYGQKTKADRCRIVIGKDTRRSSYMFEYSLVSGLTASGADVYLLHVTTTPSVSYVVRTEEFDCGIMISRATIHTMTTESRSSTDAARNWRRRRSRRLSRIWMASWARFHLPSAMQSDAPLTMRRDATAISVI